VVGPLVVNPLKLALSDRPFIENYRWAPERGTDVIALDRTTGAIAGRWTVDPLFTFHHINACEADGELVVDLCAYADARIIDDLYVDRLRGGAANALSAVRPRRLRLPLGGDAARLEPLADVDLELPRIDDARNTRPYCAAWGISGFDAIVRVDVTTGAVARWQEAGAHPGEPVHVPAPDATDEDDGVLLSVVLDRDAGRSFLLVLDAATLEEIARARLPHHVPFGFHGHFYEV
jgi:beta,beta-carotene 9',10'-dioxygenase